MAAASAAMQSCLLPEFAVGTPPSPPPVDAGHEAAPMEPACGKTWPDPPGGPDMGANEGFVLAIRSIDMGEGETDPPGYDLDRTCTCFDDGGPSCVSPVQHCDAPGGVDNGAAALINLITFAVGSGNFGSSYFSSTANQGGWSVLLQVGDYNGMADDPSVTLTLYPSPGLGGATPAWEGSDAWSVSATAVTGGDITKPLYVSPGAYVANHVLVAAIPSVAMTISGGTQTITITISDGVLTGTLTPVGNDWEISDGILAGRWAEPDIFAAFGSYRDNNGKPICTNLGFIYDEAKMAICNGLDIQVDSAGVTSLPCNALSLGIGFKAQSAVLGSVVKPPTPTPGCPPGTDPADDSCFPQLDGGDGG
jgi:hypothetical protein